MRKDIVIALVASGLIHAGAFLWDVLFPGLPPIITPAVAAPVLPVVPMPPPVPPDDPEPVPVADAPTEKVTVPAPTQVDHPQVLPDKGFVQPVQPPPPEGVKIDGGLLTVPENRGGSWKNITVFDPKQLDQQPVPKVRAQPIYPHEMRQTGRSGEVLVEFIVDTSGVVQNAFAVHASDRGFEAAAVDAVRKWKFRPGYKSGRPVNTRMQVPIVFSLAE